MIREYYVCIDGKQVGPVDRDRLQELNISPDTLVWYEGLEEWAPAGRAAGTAWLFGVEDSSADTLDPSKAKEEPQPVATQAFTAKSAEDYRKVPPMHLTAAIIITILATTPFSILAIVFYCRTAALYNDGRFEEAWHASRVARRWLVASVFAGVAVVLIVCLYIWALANINYL